jgi:hypothetical protein
LLLLLKLICSKVNKTAEKMNLTNQSSTLTTTKNNEHLKTPASPTPTMKSSISMTDLTHHHDNNNNNNTNNSSIIISSLPFKRTTSSSKLDGNFKNSSLSIDDLEMISPAKRIAQPPSSIHTDNTQTNSSDPLSNSLNWYLASCDREQAVNLLNNRDNGTFIVRPSSNPLNPSSKYTLSFVYQNEVKHFQIQETQTGYFIKSTLKPNLSSAGVLSTSASNVTVQSNLNENENSFKNLTELVIHYSTHSLVSNNQELNLMLKYPALMC